eukprot:4916554-Karenia_brevis.AAC.1
MGMIRRSRDDRAAIDGFAGALDLASGFIAAPNTFTIRLLVPEDIGEPTEDQFILAPSRGD